MEKTLFNKSEVADRLQISEGTLTTYGSRYAVYRSDGAGIYHIEHVRILEKVRAKIVTPEEGMALWEYQRLSMRRGLLNALGNVKAPRKARKDNRGNS